MTASDRTLEYGGFRLGLAVVGLGSFGLRYVRAFSQEHGVDVLWGCDPNDAVHAAALAEGAHRCTTDFSDVLNDRRVSGVVVVTPEVAHRDLSVSASGAGKHVIVEKPLATSDADARDMIDAARAASRHLLPAFLLRFDVRYGGLARRLERIGTVRSIYAYRNFDRSLFEVYSRSHSFVENAIHDIDLIRSYVNDEVDKVHAFCRNTTEHPNPNINWGILEFRNGAIAVLQSSWLYPAQSQENLQWNAGIQVMGDRGVLEVRQDGDGFRANTDDDGIALLDQSAWSELHGASRGAFGAMIRHFIDCLRGHAEPRGATAEDARIATQIAQQLIARSDEAASSAPEARRDPITTIEASGDHRV